MKKKSLALVIVVVLVCALAVSCTTNNGGTTNSPSTTTSATETPATTSTGTATTPPEATTPATTTPGGPNGQGLTLLPAATTPSVTTAYNIGVNTWGSGVPILDMFGDEAQYAIKTLGSTSVRASDDFTADKELSNIQNFCASGVSGIMMQGSAVTTVPQMAQVCESAKIPFALYVFIGSDDNITDMAKNNPYYVGAIDADMVYDGKVMADEAIKNGCTKAVLIGGNVGDNNMDQRSQGFTQEFEAKGGQVLDEARCTDASECLTKATDMLSAHMDADCLYSFVGDYIPGSLQAIDTLNLTGQVKVFMSCVDESSAQLIKAGQIVEGNDGIGLSASLSTTLLFNYLDGHAIKDSNGQAPRFRTIPFLVTASNADAYLNVFYNNSHPFTEQMLETLCWRYNPDVSYQTYVDFINNLNLDSILEAHGQPAPAASTTSTTSTAPAA